LKTLAQRTWKASSLCDTGWHYDRVNGFEALHASGVTELVGREGELELLLRR